MWYFVIILIIIIIVCIFFVILHGRKSGGTEEDFNKISEWLRYDRDLLDKIFDNLGIYKNDYINSILIINNRFNNLQRLIYNYGEKIENIRQVRNLRNNDRNNDSFSKIFYYDGLRKIGIVNEYIGAELDASVKILTKMIKNTLTKIYFETTIKYFNEIHYLPLTNDQIILILNNINVISNIQNDSNNIIINNIDYNDFKKDMSIYDFNKQNIEKFYIKFLFILNNNIQPANRVSGVIITIIKTYLGIVIRCVKQNVPIIVNTVKNINQLNSNTNIANKTSKQYDGIVTLYKKTGRTNIFSNQNDLTVQYFYNSGDRIKNYINFYDNICDSFYIDNRAQPGQSFIINYINENYIHYNDDDDENLTNLDKFKLIKQRKNEIYKFYNSDNEINLKYNDDIRLVNGINNNNNPDGVGIDLEGDDEGSIKTYVRKFCNDPTETNYWKIFNNYIKNQTSDDTSPIEVYPRKGVQNHCKVTYISKSEYDSKPKEDMKNKNPDMKDFSNIYGVIYGNEYNIAKTHKLFCKEKNFIYDKEYNTMEKENPIQLGPDVVYYNNGVWMTSIKNGLISSFQ